MLWNKPVQPQPITKFNSILAVDCKPELSKKSVDETRKDIKIINPTSKNSPYGFNVFYDLTPESSDDELKTRCNQISHSLIPDLSGDNSHFSGTAQNLLTGFLMYGFRKGLKFTEAIRKIKAVRTEDFIAEVLTDPAMKSHPKVVNMLKQYEGNTSDEFKSVQDTLIKDLDIFESDAVQWCFDKNPKKAVPEDLLDGISIFFAIPDYLLTDYKFVFGMCIELCVKKIMSTPEEMLEEKNPICLLLDEGGTIYIPSLLDALSRGRSKKLQVILIAQSISQLKKLYGKEEADAIIDCCKSTIVFSCYDNVTAKTLSERTGYYRETKISAKKNASSLVQTTSSESVSEEYRPCLDVSDINRLERSNEVLVFNKGLWFIVQKCPFFKIKKYLDCSNYLKRKNLERTGGKN